jgi:CMP/dCMP kinase
LDKKITIAIDGFSSTGKSTLAKQLANHLGYVYVDTGAMYRAIAYFAMKNEFINIKHFDKFSLVKMFAKYKIAFSIQSRIGLCRNVFER